MAFALLEGLKTKRFMIAFMIFTAGLMSFFITINMSLNIVAMTEPIKRNRTLRSECITNDTKKKSIIIYKTENFGERYNWTRQTQSHILGSYFWGYAISCLFGGPLAERFGPRKIVFLSNLILSIFTLLGPVLADWDYLALLVSRILIGLCGGVIYPCIHCLISKWAPPDEKGKFGGTVLGGTMGVVLGWPLLGVTIKNLGWVWSFYINGIIVCLWCVAWLFLVYDMPATHPRISEKEKLYIMNSLKDTVKYELSTGLPPYKDIFRSVPFWALAFLHYGNMWGFYFIIIQEPAFISNVLGIRIEHTGFLSSIPYMARFISGLIFGSIGDYIRQKDCISPTAVRKAFVVFFVAHFIPGSVLFFLYFFGCDINWLIGLQTVSLGCNGAATLTNIQNVQDLAPNYAGTIFSLIGSIGTTTGIIIPIVVSQITGFSDDLKKWYICFSVGGAVYIVTGIIFCIFGSAKVQPWNELQEPPTQPEQEQQSPQIST